MEGYARTMKSERAYSLDYFRRSIPRRNFWLYSRGRWNLEESEYLDAMAAYIAMAPDQCPYRRPKLTDDKIKTLQGNESPDCETYIELIFPSLNATYQAVTRVRAMIRCLRVLNALQTHVPAGSNTVPKLADLGLPVETTMDPYTYPRKPLHVKKLPQGWLVYSVGPNGQDDGGKVSDSYSNTGDTGVGPPSLLKADEPAKK